VKTLYDTRIKELEQVILILILSITLILILILILIGLKGTKPRSRYEGG